IKWRRQWLRQLTVAEIPKGQKACRGEEAESTGANRPIECGEAFGLLDLFGCLVSKRVTERVLRLADCLVEFLDLSNLDTVLQGFIRITKLQSRSVSARFIAQSEKFIVHTLAFGFQR